MPVNDYGRSPSVYLNSCGKMPLPPKPKQFQFVNIDKPEQSNHAKTQKLVRRHVMQQQLHKRLVKQSRQLETPPKDEDDAPNRVSSDKKSSKERPTSTSMCSCFGAFEDAIAFSKNNGQLLSVEECLLCGRPLLTHAEVDTVPKADSLQMVRLRPNTDHEMRLGAGRADPFASYAVPMSQYMHGLLDHCKRNFIIPHHLLSSASVHNWHSKTCPSSHTQSNSVVLRNNEFDEQRPPSHASRLCFC